MHSENSDVFPFGAVAVAVTISPPDIGAVIPVPVSISASPFASVENCDQPIHRAPSPFPLGSHASLA
jgi:hypothetical protein